MQKLLAHGFIFTLLFGGTALSAEATALYENPIKYGGITTIPELLLALVDLVFLIGVPIIVICIIYAGFLFVSAGDNESQIAKAKMVFMWTVIGALVLLGAKAIAMAIQETVLSLGAT
jgi:hypothetical protein